ncbi:MAG TPA: hypothetical protein VJO15_04715 [Dehalococcoidia bacterium]|nr:hypothetical protein [Dehalococcoidia bacterium]
MLTGQSVLFELLYLANISHATRGYMVEYMSSSGWLSSEGVEYLATSTLSHIEDMHDGFTWTLRASEAELDELRYLLVGYSPLEGQDEAHCHSVVVPPEVMRQVQALQHAKVVFGVIPRLPQGQATFPDQRSYFDIMPPKGVADLCDRIVELERGVWDTAMRKPPDSTDLSSFRRVFGFFDAAAWLATSQASLFRQSPGLGA